DDRAALSAMRSGNHLNRVVQQKRDTLDRLLRHPSLLDLFPFQDSVLSPGLSSSVPNVPSRRRKRSLPPRRGGAMVRRGHSPDVTVCMSAFWTCNRSPNGFLRIGHATIITQSCVGDTPRASPTDQSTSRARSDHRQTRSFANSVTGTRLAAAARV